MPSASCLLYKVTSLGYAGALFSLLVTFSPHSFLPLVLFFRGDFMALHLLFHLSLAVVVVDYYYYYHYYYYYYFYYSYYYYCYYYYYYYY